MVDELGHVLDQFQKNNIRIRDLQDEGGFADNLQKKRRCDINNVNKFIGTIAKNYMETTEGDNWASNLINHLNTQFPTSIDPPKGLQNYIQQEVQDGTLAQIVSQRLTPCHSSLPDLLPVFGNSNSFCSPENYMNFGYNEPYSPASLSFYNPGLCGGSTFNDYYIHNGTNVHCGGMNLIPPLGVNQSDLEQLITSPEQVSSITACSYGDVVSDTEAFDSRVKNSFQHQPFYNGQYRSSTTAYSMDFPVLLGDDVQSPYSNPCNVQPNLPETINGDSLKPQIQMSVSQQPSTNILFVNGEKSTVQGGYKIGQIKTREYVDLESSRAVSSFEVLNAYVIYKDMPAHLRREVSFQDYMHAAECKEKLCNCHLYLELASHFDKCHSLDCNTCGPVRSLCTTVESRKRKRDLLDNGDQLPRKYIKLESETVGDGLYADSLGEHGPPEVVAVGPTVMQPEVVTMGPTVIQPEVVVNCANGEDTMESSNPKEPESTNKETKDLPSDHLSSKEKTEEDGCNLDSNKSIVPYVDCESNKSMVDNDVDSGLKQEKIKIQSVSLADFFTADQIRDFLLSITPKKDVSENRAPSIGQNTCQLCSMDKLVFAPAPIYCSSCDTRIKRNVGYYRSNNEAIIKHCFCMSCYRGSHGTNISMRGFSIPKSNLQKAKNDEEKEDSWVLCDRCQCWQHRICGLYNDDKDVEGKAEYICPKCYLEELEGGMRVPLPETTASGAKDLPRTSLSDHIEERLATRLNQERQEMAKISGMDLDQIPTAEGLVVRVVVSVEKQLAVRQKFIDILNGEDYPSGFTYRSKLIFLFQKIEGVDVCLFGMCVQEFGSECGGPNRRCVYISYLDSVKYFRPERKSVTGESLRTFVYHEILIGYLEYCKKRGFATCYIWACPLIKGEDYIFYCHPETQRTPKQDKLRQWYKSMLKKAVEDDVVLDHTNLYNQFFVSSGHRNTKITAARLPYFEGDYWSGAAENIVRKLEVEESSGGGLQSKLPNKRILKSMGQDKPEVAMKDVLVMQKLGQTILPVKENFMIVHLQHICTHCREVILSGSRWFCSHCKKIQLCSSCFNADKIISESKMHTCHSGEKSLLSEAVVGDVSIDTKDEDDVVVNSFFETRDAFLNKCQKSHFQFDTLGRAKYSSMMILYHLIHKPVIKPPTCTACHKEVVVEDCWQCDMCPKYYVCGPCHKMKGGGAYHPHRLTSPSSMEGFGNDQEVQNPNKALSLKGLMDSLIHASRCEKTQCSYSECITLRRLFYHSSRCNVRFRGGCKFCQRVWWILKEHSRICKDSDCGIPRCMDIKKHKKMLAANRKQEVGQASVE